MRGLFRGKREAVAQLCEAHGVSRLEVFGSAVRDGGFDPARSDIDLLVTFLPGAGKDIDCLLDLEEGFQALFGRPVDLLDREALERSRNPIKRRSILKAAERIYG